MSEEPDAPEPDTKDWTWTLRRRCPECGLTVGDLDVGEVGRRLFVAAEEWAAILRSSPAVNARPAPRVWSPLEYGAHVRDIVAITLDRARAMMAQDDPLFANWNQDAAAIESRYAEADPEVVADELEVLTEALAVLIAGLTAADLVRRGRRSNGSEFTVLSLLRYSLHDIVHHLWDVTGQQDAAESLEIG